MSFLRLVGGLWVDPRCVELMSLGFLPMMAALVDYGGVAFVVPVVGVCPFGVPSGSWFGEVDLGTSQVSQGRERAVSMLGEAKGDEGAEDLSSLEVGEHGEFLRISRVVSNEMLRNLGLGGESREEGGRYGMSRSIDEGLKSPNGVVESPQRSSGIVGSRPKTGCTALNPVGIVKEAEEGA
jgi:hypothetical protein